MVGERGRRHRLSLFDCLHCSTFTVKITLLFRYWLEVSAPNVPQNKQSHNQDAGGKWKPVSLHTCVAGVVAHGQRISVIVWVHREEAHSEGSILGISGAVFKVLQVDAQLVVALDGEGMDLLQPCRGRRSHQSVCPRTTV